MKASSHGRRPIQARLMQNRSSRPCCPIESTLQFLRSKVRRNESTLQFLRSTVRRNESALQFLRRKVSRNWKSDAEDLRIQAAMLADQLNAIKVSTSWRLTSPLRRVLNPFPKLARLGTRGAQANLVDLKSSTCVAVSGAARDQRRHHAPVGAGPVPFDCRRGATRAAVPTPANRAKQ